VEFFYSKILLLGMVPVGMFMNMNMNSVPPRYFQQQQQNAIQKAAQQSRARKVGPIGGGSSQGQNRNSQQFRGRGSQPGPLTQGGMSQMMSQPGFSLSQQPDFSQDFAAGDFAAGGQSQGDGLLSQDFTNSQGPDKFYSNFHSQSGNNF
jgi:regulator of nonsense transcripts 1